MIGWQIRCELRERVESRWHQDLGLSNRKANMDFLGDKGGVSWGRVFRASVGDMDELSAAAHVGRELVTAGPETCVQRAWAGHTDVELKAKALAMSPELVKAKF